MPFTTSYEFKTTLSYTDSDPTALAFNSDLAILTGGAHVFSQDAPGGTGFFSVYANATENYDFVFFGNQALAALNNGNLVTAGQDSDSIVFRITSPQLATVITTDITRNNSSNADVAALTTGGFVISSQKVFSATDTDIYLDFYNASGGAHTTTVVDGSLANDTDASIATLDNGNVAVAWTRTVGGASQIWTAVYTSAGGVVTAPVLVDASGSINRHAAITAIAGGYALAYEDNEAGLLPDIKVTALDLTGAVTNSRFVLTPGIFGGPAGQNYSDNNAAIARLSNGMLAVTWDVDFGTDHDTARALLDGSLITLTSGYVLVSAADELNGAIAAFGLGSFAMTNQKTAGDILEIREVAAVRVMTGTSGKDVIVALNDMDHHLIGDAGDDQLTGGAGNDVLDGGAGKNKLFGGAGADILNGDSLADALDGGTGADTMNGGGGNDVYTVDDNGDVIVEAFGGGTDSVKSTAASYVLSDEVETLTLMGTGDIDGTGNGLKNTLTGNSGANHLWGLDGNDKLDGKGGADIMEGGAGNDTYYVDNVGDQVIETDPSAVGGKDTVNVTASVFTLGANIENGAALSAGAQTLVGNELANTLKSKGNVDDFSVFHELWGQGGKDVLVGGSGSDGLHGGMGADKLTGGGGRDGFYFNELETSKNKDTIVDFSLADHDYVALYTSAFTGLTFQGGFNIDPGEFGLGSAAANTTQRILYDQSTGNLWYDEDGSAAAHAAILVATLSNHAALTAADIYVF